MLMPIFFGGDNPRDERELSDPAFPLKALYRFRQKIRWIEFKGGKWPVCWFVWERGHEVDAIYRCIG